MSFTALLNKTAIVTRRDDTENSLGERVGEYVTVGTVSVALQEDSGGPGENQESTMLLGGEDDRPTTRIWFNLNSDIRRNDRIIVDGVTYRVGHSPTNSAGRNHHREATVFEVVSG